jgi:ribosomal protein L37AE/L43A
MADKINISTHAAPCCCDAPSLGLNVSTGIYVCSKCKRTMKLNKDGAWIDQDNVIIVTAPLKLSNGAVKVASLSSSGTSGTKLPSA